MHQNLHLSALSSLASTSAKLRNVAGSSYLPRGLRLALLGALFTSQLALAQPASYTLEIKDHQFSPATLEVPSGQKLTLLVKNLDATPEEFESDDLRREKLIPAGKQITLTVGPLKPGTYKFKGEFHPATAQGTLIAK